MKRRLALTCRVMRDGVERMLPVNTVVPGDLVLLSVGNLIPADGLVIWVEDFLVSGASMTSESFPVEKRPGTVKPEAGLSARTNAVFLGASVRSGRRRSSSSKPVSGLRLGLSRHGLEPASPRRILDAVCASSDTF